MKKLIARAFIILLFEACHNGPAKKEDASPISSQTDKPAATEAKSTQIMVTITGGANEGNYTASSETATCSTGLTGAKSFGNQYSVSGKSDNELSSLQLIVDDYEAAKTGTDKFYIKVAFGKRLEGAKYEINGSDNSMAGQKQGSGKLTITESGTSKIVNIEGKTGSNVDIKAVITCNGIISANGGQ